METKIRTSKWDPAVDDQDKSLTVEACVDPWLADRDLKPLPASLVKVYTGHADPNRAADVLWLTAVRSADCQARQLPVRVC
jgi:hypothetical protein